MLQIIPVGAEDEKFLFELYVSTRYEEVAAWGWDDRTILTFLAMQRTAQMRNYASHYPDADHRIICINQSRAGRILSCNRDDTVTLVDISLLPTFRRQGIGTCLIQEMQATACQEGKPLRLSVIKENPAKCLYERLGFLVIADNGLYEQMEWRKISS